jgi:Flp pilus assembly protein TadG
MKLVSRGSALIEFALAWPIVLLLVLGSVELAVWASEVAAARGAAIAGARAGTVAGASADVAARVAARALSASLIGVRAAAWCPGNATRPPPVWVCATDQGSALRVDVGGTVPALVPLISGTGLPLNAHVALDKETYVR